LARPQIFDLRRDGQNIKDSTSPECGATARQHLINAIDAGETMFQAIYEGSTTVQANQGTMYQELESFHREMNRIGFPISRPL
jgi:hypothetical protein